MKQFPVTRAYEEIEIFQSLEPNGGHEMTLDRKEEKMSCESAAFLFRDFFHGFYLSHQES